MCLITTGPGHCMFQLSFFQQPCTECMSSPCNVVVVDIVGTKSTSYAGDAWSLCGGADILGWVQYL